MKATADEVQDEVGPVKEVRTARTGRKTACFWTGQKLWATFCFPRKLPPMNPDWNQVKGNSFVNLLLKCSLAIQRERSIYKGVNFTQCDRRDLLQEGRLLGFDLARLDHLLGYGRGTMLGVSFARVLLDESLGARRGIDVITKAEGGALLKDELGELLEVAYA